MEDSWKFAPPGGSTAWTLAALRGWWNMFFQAYSASNLTTSDLFVVQDLGMKSVVTTSNTVATNENIIWKYFGHIISGIE